MRRLFLRALAAATALALGTGFQPSKASATPDISGVWNHYPPLPGTFSGQPDPPEWDPGTPPLREPYMSEWKTLQARRAAAEAAGKPLPDDSTLCLPDGTPQIMFAHYALQILQNPNLRQITILSEFMAEIRRIYLDEDLPPLDDIDPSYFGYSVAKWNGDVLEVTTAGIKESVRFMDIPHSPNMIIREKLFIGADGLLNDDVSIDDDEYLTRPFNFKIMYKKEPLSYKIGEFVCDNQHSVLLPDGSVGMKVEDK